MSGSYLCTLISPREVFLTLARGEKEFGGADNDERHRLKREHIYLPVLRGQVDGSRLDGLANGGAQELLRTDRTLIFRAGSPQDVTTRSHRITRTAADPMCSA